MKNNINSREYDKKANVIALNPRNTSSDVANTLRQKHDKKAIIVALNPRNTSSDVANTLRQKYFQPKSLNTFLSLIKKDPIKHSSELTNGDIKKINTILTKSRKYFRDLHDEIGQEYKFISEMNIDKWHLDIAKKCIQFLKSNNNFASYHEFNEKYATISNFNFYVNCASETIKRIETKKGTICNVSLTLIYRTILLAMSYLDPTIGPEKPPKQAKAQLPRHSTSQKKAAAA